MYIIPDTENRTISHQNHLILPQYPFSSIVPVVVVVPARCVFKGRFVGEIERKRRIDTTAAAADDSYEC